MGLGKVNQNNATFLSIAGGFIWNRKADKTDPDYAEQTYVMVDGSERVRTGARYADITGKIIGVQFKTHDEFGENINVTIDGGGERYIISISTNNRYSQDFMKFLLVGDISKSVYVKPYDFIGSDKKRAQGILFKQNGEKISLKIDDAPTKDGEWFKTATKKQIKRFFEDLNDWFVAEVEEKVCPKFVDIKQSDEETEEENQTETNSKPKEETKENKTNEDKEQVKATPLKMKKFLREYISENYEGEELPKEIKGEELVKWYNLALSEEELPFDENQEENDDDDAEVPSDDLEDQLNALMK